MAAESIRKNTKIVERIIDEMCLFDDDLMSVAFDGNTPAAELLLKILLNIEVQKKPEGAHIRRARFHSSMMDSRMLREGQGFSKLRDSYIIFIMEADIFGHGIPIYTVNRHFEEINGLFDDGSHIVYVNGSYKGEDAVGKLMHDFRCKKSKDIYYWELARSVKQVKEEEGGRRIMCEAVEKYAEKYAEGKRLDALYEAVKNLMESMKLSAEQAMAAIKVSETDRAILLKRL